MLTDTEVDKLKEGRDKANDFIVRTKFKKWLEGLYVVNIIILTHLPQKQLAKLIKIDHINYLSNLIISFLWLLGAVPITQIEEEYMVFLPDCPPRYAEGGELRLNGMIKLLINNLFQFLSNEDIRDVIQTEINRYQPDYALIKRSVNELPGLVRRLSMDELIERQRAEKEGSRKDETKEEPK